MTNEERIESLKRELEYIYTSGSRGMSLRTDKTRINEIKRQIEELENERRS